MPHTMNMNILLLNPAPSGTLQAAGVLFPPLRLLYVAAYAEKEGHHVVVEELALEKRRVKPNFSKFDMVGISVDTTRYDQALRLAKKATLEIWHHIKKHRLGFRTLFRFLKDYFMG